MYESPEQFLVISQLLHLKEKKTETNKQTHKQAERFSSNTATQHLFKLMYHDTSLTRTFKPGVLKLF